MLYKIWHRRSLLTRNITVVFTHQLINEWNMQIQSADSPLPLHQYVNTESLYVISLWEPSPVMFFPCCAQWIDVAAVVLYLRGQVLPYTLIPVCVYMQHASCSLMGRPHFLFRHSVNTQTRTNTHFVSPLPLSISFLASVTLSLVWSGWPPAGDEELCVVIYWRVEALEKSRSISSAPQHRKVSVVCTCTDWLTGTFWCCWLDTALEEISFLYHSEQ